MPGPDALRSHRVVVVGAGIGGLVSALELAHRGLQVTVIEAANTPGGKMRQVHVDGAAIDSGPTVFTMRWVFDQWLARMGTSLAEMLPLEPLKPEHVTKILDKATLKEHKAFSFHRGNPGGGCAHRVDGRGTASTAVCRAHGAESCPHQA